MSEMIKIKVGNDIRIVEAIPKELSKEVVVPFNWGFLKQKGIVVGQYQYLGE